MALFDLAPLTQKLRRPEDSHKGRFGTSLLIGGAEGMTGGLILAGLGALYSGSGLTKLLSLHSDCPAFVPNHPEMMVYRDGPSAPTTQIEALGATAIGLGPGLGQSERALAYLEAALEAPCPFVIDADGLNLLATHRLLFNALRSRTHGTVLTPHPGEAARLLNRSVADIQSKRPEAIEALVKMTGCIVLLKGRGTLIQSPDGDHHCANSGNPGMASGGMGDVLTGAITSLLAQGLSTWEATLLGQELHSQAADACILAGKGPVGLTASEVALALRRLINESMSL